MDGNSEAWWECVLVGSFKNWTLRIASCCLWDVSLHEFVEFLGEVSRWGMLCVLGVEQFVSYKGFNLLLFFPIKLCQNLPTNLGSLSETITSGTPCSS